jgi:bifunctional non-homologous end joining protein LigD
MAKTAKRRLVNARNATNRAIITHPDKVYWPRDGITKGELIDYYRMIGPLMLPYLRDRPQSLNRFPNGIAAKNFYQKDVSRQPPPDWVRTEMIDVDVRTKDMQMVICDNLDTLLYLANLGCIEINPWNSRVENVEQPDWVVIDLDPEDVSFAQVIETAKTVHRVLEKADVPSCCKTSGKTGLHIYVPLGAKYDYEVGRRFAEIVANIVKGLHPNTTSVVRSPALRRNRVYVDFLQNSRGQTLAAPYSVRPAPGAPVSTPLKWSEVKAGLDPKKFTIFNMEKRTSRLGDLWKPVIGRGADLEDGLDRLMKVSPQSKRASR